MIKTNNLVTLNASPSDDEYLASVYLEFDEQEYFTLAFSEYEKDEAIYIENVTQSQSIRSNNIDYKLSNDSLIFSFDDEIRKSLNLKHNTFYVSFDLNKEDHKNLKESLKAVFKNVKN